MHNIRQKIKEKQKGFTLVELMVTLAISSLAIVLTAQMSSAFYHRYRMIETRWKAQNAARHVMQYFDLRAESLSNSASISLFYTDMQKNPQPLPAEEPPAAGALPQQVSNVMAGIPAEGNKSYAYIYSMPDVDHPEQGDKIWVLERNIRKKMPDGTVQEIKNKPVSLTEYLMHQDIPLNIRFSVAVAPVDVELTEIEGEPTYIYQNGEDSYLRTTVDVEISTPKSVGGNYTLRSSFTMNNMAKNQFVNCEGEDFTPVQDKSKLDIAGWTNQKLNDEGKCPANTTEHPFAQKPANILRYVSTSSFLESQNLSGQGVDLQGAGLCFGRLSMRGSKFEAQTIGALHDFRDNVLSKTALGQRVIDAYYHTISPALLSAAAEHPSLLKVGKAILLPTSFIACLVAD